MEYDEIVKNLNEKVSKLSKEDISIEQSLTSYNINKNPIYYGVIPVIAYLTLYLTKPEFVMSTDTVFKDEVYLEKKISHKKILTATLIITLSIYFSYFAYQYKKQIE